MNIRDFEKMLTTTVIAGGGITQAADEPFLLGFAPMLPHTRPNPPADRPGINLADEQAAAKRQQISAEQSTHNLADLNQPTRRLENRWVTDGWRKLITPASCNRPDAKPDFVKSLSNKTNQWWQPLENNN